MPPAGTQRKFPLWAVIVISIIGVLLVAGIISAIVNPRKETEVADTTTTATTTTPTTAEAPATDPPVTDTTTSTPPETSPPTTAAPASGDAATIAALQAWLAEGFAGTSWLPMITGYKVQSHAFWIDTSLYPDSDATAPSRAMCAAVSTWIINHPDSGITGLRVAARDGQRLAMRTSITPSDSC